MPIFLVLGVPRGLTPLSPFNSPRLPSSRGSYKECALALLVISLSLSRRDWCLFMTGPFTATVRNEGEENREHVGWFDPFLLAQRFYLNPQS